MSTYNSQVQYVTEKESRASAKPLPSFQYETVSPARKIARDLLVGPLINHIIPPPFLIKVLQNSKSELAHETLARPGSWRSMMISYSNRKPKDAIDAMVIKYGSFPMGLRNRKRLVVRRLIQLMDYYNSKRGCVYLVGVGAGTGINTVEAVSHRKALNIHAHLFDLADDAFAVGEDLKRQHGVEKQIHFIKADVAELDKYIKIKPDIVKLIGIIEYLSDENLHKLLRDVTPFLSDESTIVVNTIEDAHNVDRFLKRVFNLSFHYRSPARLMEILRQHGYGDFEVEYEPLKVYSLLTAHRR